MVKVIWLVIFLIICIIFFFHLLLLLIYTGHTNNIISAWRRYTIFETITRKYRQQNEYIHRYLYGWENNLKKHHRPKWPRPICCLIVSFTPSHKNLYMVYILYSIYLPIFIDIYRNFTIYRLYSLSRLYTI